MTTQGQLESPNATTDPIHRCQRYVVIGAGADQFDSTFDGLVTSRSTCWRGLFGRVQGSW